MAIATRLPQLDTLVLSRDDQTIRTFEPLGAVAGLNAQVCTTADLAVEMLARCRFDAVVVDCESIPESMSVIKSLRCSPSNRTTVIVAIVRDTKSIDAFRTGATFVLEKDSAPERGRAALRAAYGLMLLSRRRYHRRPAAADAIFRSASGKEFRVRTVNVSEGGLGVEANCLPNRGDTGVVDFMLPDSCENIRATVEVMWSEGDRAGMRFTHIRSDRLAALHSWIAENLRSEQPVRTLAGLC